MKDFKQFIETLKPTILPHDFYVDFKKVFKNIDDISYNLNVLNHLIGQPNFDDEFYKMFRKNPDVVSVLPILLAVRQNKIIILDKIIITYDFHHHMEPSYYLDFIKKTKLIDIFYDHRVKNLVDYVTGIEVGLDSNGRKNRSGQIMSKIVFEHLNKCKDIEIIPEASLQKIKANWDIKIDIPNKTFDFAVKDSLNHIYLIEVNYYSGGGSKLNEISRSYIKLAQDLKDKDNLSFMWITDGTGWLTAKKDLNNAYDVIEHLYNINDLENKRLDNVFNQKKK